MLATDSKIRAAKHSLGLLKYGEDVQSMDVSHLSHSNLIEGLNQKEELKKEETNLTILRKMQRDFIISGGKLSKNKEVASKKSSLFNNQNFQSF